MLDLLQYISTLLVQAVSIEIKKRLMMGLVMGFVVHCFPTGLFACASRPLADATLDLVTTYTTRQNPG
jgi:hypothetical protein